MQHTTATGEYRGQHRVPDPYAGYFPGRSNYDPRHSWEDTDGLAPHAAVRARWLIRQQTIRRRPS